MDPRAVAGRRVRQPGPDVCLAGAEVGVDLDVAGADQAERTLPSGQVTALRRSSTSSLGTRTSIGDRAVKWAGIAQLPPPGARAGVDAGGVGHQGVGTVVAGQVDIEVEGELVVDEWRRHPHLQVAPRLEVGHPQVEAHARRGPADRLGSRRPWGFRAGTRPRSSWLVPASRLTSRTRISDAGPGAEVHRAKASGSRCSPSRRSQSMGWRRSRTGWPVDSPAANCTVASPVASSGGHIEPQVGVDPLHVRARRCAGRHDGWRRCEMRGT